MVKLPRKVQPDELFCPVNRAFIIFMYRRNNVGPRTEPCGSLNSLIRDYTLTHSLKCFHCSKKQFSLSISDHASQKLNNGKPKEKACCHRGNEH